MRALNATRNRVVMYPYVDAFDSDENDSHMLLHLSLSPKFKAPSNA
jgi:hypothetical protein